MENVTKVHIGDKEIILVATAHVSRESVDLVKQVIEEERPDSVCIELDDERYSNMRNPQAWEKTDIVNVIKSKRVGYMLANLALSSYQKKVAKNLNTNVGGEMLQSIESANEIGAELVMADRNIQTTFMRIWRKMNLIEKVKLLFSLFFSLDDDEEITDETLEELLKQDMLESAMSALKAEFPKIGDILIHERDQHLASKIKDAPGPLVVAVLGGAHVPGITRALKSEKGPASAESLTALPPKSPWGKIIGWGIPAVIMALIIYGFATNL
ncbi:MAG: TraB domain-containing protein, partial [Oscillospiraceae bacterium]|nr:TraB domain-containing protein [Oscillospiraceae bacterium]